MPLLTGAPGLRPGDFCVDDVTGDVKVRRADQSVLILRAAAGIPSWAQPISPSQYH